MTAKFINASVTSLKGLDKSLTTELRADAVKAGWPAKVAKNLTVTVDKLSILIKYPDEYNQQVDDLEYGTEDLTPKPIFRTFLNKHSDLIDNQVSEWSLDYLINGDIIP
jgi:hypothetical protein